MHRTRDHRVPYDIGVDLLEEEASSLLCLERGANADVQYGKVEKGYVRYSDNLPAVDFRSPQISHKICFSDSV